MHKEVSCRKRTVVVIAVVVCILFIIGISIPAGKIIILRFSVALVPVFKYTTVAIQINLCILSAVEMTFKFRMC